MGYLVRRSTLWPAGGGAAAGNNEGDEAAAEKADEDEAATEKEDEDEEEEVLEEDEDDAAVPPPRRTGARLEGEYSVVWSASYRVPMLCFRAWDESEFGATEQKRRT